MDNSLRRLSASAWIPPPSRTRTSSLTSLRSRCKIQTPLVAPPPRSYPNILSSTSLSCELKISLQRLPSKVQQKRMNFSGLSVSCDVFQHKGVERNLFSSRKLPELLYSIPETVVGSKLAKGLLSRMVVLNSTAQQLLLPHLLIPRSGLYSLPFWTSNYFFHSGGQN